MTKLGVQGGPDEAEVKQEVVKDPKVFTVVQPTFVPIPIQTTEPMRKPVPSTWCLMARLLAFVLIGSLLFSMLVFLVWNKDDVARAISGDKTVHFTLSEPQFAQLNSQAQQRTAEEKKTEDEKDDGAQITIKQTDEGAQMIIQLPKAPQSSSSSEETKDGVKSAETPSVIPVLQLIPSRSDETSEQQQEETSSEAEDEDEHRPMHPYEMQGPSPDAFNYPPMMAIQAARAAQYENEMRMWRMRRLQQMLVLAAVQQAQQREAAMRYMMFQRQQWAQQQMAMQQAMEARRQAEWQEYWRRATIARMMQQQQMQQQAVASSWQPAAEQPRPWWTQQQQPMMAWPQQQFFQQQPPQQPMPFWMQQQQQQPSFFEQQQQQQQAAQMHQRQQMEMQQSQSQSQSHSEEEQEQQPQPQPHAFIFIRRFFPIPQDSRESHPAVSSEESNEKNIPLRPHDASAQQIVEQMRGSNEQRPLPDAPLPGIHDRIFQHFQSLSQQMQDRSGQSQVQSQPPLFASVPNSVESNSASPEHHNYDQDAIYEKLQRKAMQMQQDGTSTSVQVDKSDSHSKEESGEDDHDIRKGDAVLGANDKTAQDIRTTTEPVMIENFVRAQAHQEDKEEEKDDEDELTSEEKSKVAQIDSAELKEAAALEASLEREAKEQEEKDRSEVAKVEEGIVAHANKDSSSASSEQKDEEATTTTDPLSEFFRFFENEAVKLSAQEKSGERMVVDSETGTHQPAPATDEEKDEENSSETKPDEEPTSVETSTEEVSASIDAVPVSNEADIKVSQVANSREVPTLAIAAA